MKLSPLILLLFFTVPTLAGEITLNCDSRVINEKACTALLQGALKTAYCPSKTINCLLHPWGSDFIKSWICSADSSECSPALQGSCPSGTTHIFNQEIDVCSQSKPSTFHAFCRHEHASHSISVKNCSDGPEVCAKFGGTPDKCVQVEGYSDQWAISCIFPSLDVEEIGSSCSELKSKCELINADKGVKGSLVSCLPENKKTAAHSPKKGPFDSN